VNPHPGAYSSRSLKIQRKGKKKKRLELSKRMQKLVQYVHRLGPCFRKVQIIKRDIVMAME
jgi:hypothetical protein